MRRLLVLGLMALAVACAPSPPAAVASSSPDCAAASSSPDPNLPAPAIGPDPSPAATTLGVYGKVYEREGCVAKAVEGVCISLGRPGARCWAKTDANGNYFIDLDNIVDGSANTKFWLGFTKDGYPFARTGDFDFHSNKLPRVDFRLSR